MKDASGVAEEIKGKAHAERKRSINLEREARVFE
jgi:hypothetical protein